MKSKRLSNTNEAFDLAAFYYTFDRFYAKRDPYDDEHSYVIVKSEDEKHVFYVENDYLDEKVYEYDLDVVYLDDINE